MIGLARPPRCAGGTAQSCGTCQAGSRASFWGLLGAAASSLPGAAAAHLPRARMFMIFMLRSSLRRSVYSLAVRLNCTAEPRSWDELWRKWD